MSVEDPNKNFNPEEALLRKRFKEIMDHLNVLERSVQNRELPSTFIYNVVGNLLNYVTGILELLELGENRILEKRVEIEERFYLAEKYLDILTTNEEALQSEVSIDLKTWLKMGQREVDHAREVVAKYTT